MSAATSAEMVVVGAGVMGAWTALAARRGGHDVLLVDAHGAGNPLASSGDETRVTRSGHGRDEHYARWQRASLADWRALGEERGEELVVDTGVLWLAHEESGVVADSLTTLQRLGIPARRMDRAGLAARWPQIRTDDLAWALHEPEGGVLVARRALLASVNALRAVGGRVEKTRVVPPDASDASHASAGRLRRLRLADGSSLIADAFVFAAGPWLPGLLPDVLPRDQLLVTRQELVYLATPAGSRAFDAGELPTWADHRAAIYGLPSIGGSGAKIAPDWPGPETDPERQDRTVGEATLSAVRDYVERRLPGLAGQPVASGRVCQYASTPDAHFIIDRHPAWENAWVVGGGSGHAFKHGPAIGRYAAALATGDTAVAAVLVPPDQRFALGPRLPAGTGLRTSAARPDAAGD